MAKELPYFQFEPAEYLTKDVSFCSLEAQGLFINICSYYWQRNCELTKGQLLRRLNYEKALNELISEGVIDLDGENISIKFLDLQRGKAIDLSSKNKANGEKGGRPKKANKNPNETQTKATQKPNERHKIREDKIREDNIKKYTPEIPSFDEFLDYALEKKPNVSTNALKLKYEAWKMNEWKDGNDKIINKWQLKLLHTLPHIKENGKFDAHPKYNGGNTPSGITL